MIDFTDCPRNPFKTFNGANGQKISVRYDGHQYMLKFPPRAKSRAEGEYANSCISEHICCQILRGMGMNAQETLLGVYTDRHGNRRNVVACRDFAEGNKTLVEFAHLKNTCLDSDLDGYNTDLASILRAIDEQRLIMPDRLRTFFWNQFVGDALLANFDRHNGNWGVLVNERIRHADVAPVYDCGSCLFPQLDDTGMERVLSSPYEVSDRVRLFPKSTIMVDRARINYYDYITSLENIDCDAAVSFLYNRIDMDRIEGVLDATPGITPLQHRFYLTIIGERKKGIIDRAVDALERKG